MIRFVAALLLALLGTVHAWAGVDGGLPGRSFVPGEYVASHAGLHSAGHHGFANRDASMQGIDNCCSEPGALVVSAFFQCTLDGMIVVPLNIMACPKLIHKGAGFHPVRTTSNYRGYIFRPPII